VQFPELPHFEQPLIKPSLPLPLHFVHFPVPLQPLHSAILFSPFCYLVNHAEIKYFAARDAESVDVSGVVKTVFARDESCFRHDFVNSRFDFFKRIFADLPRTLARNFVFLLPRKQGDERL
jgi:hypothetical protein